jgi:C4-dicarboxylate transporter, DctM subunit
MFSTLIIAIVLLALLEAPLFTVIAGLSTVCFYFIDYDALALHTILIEMNRLASMPVLVALPLFTFVGCLLTETQAPRRIMNLMQAVLGWLPGGLAIAAICSCAFFTALTGASGVTIVALGGLLYPILLERSYSDKFALGLLTTSGSRGLLFPPSLPIILYGVVARIDIPNIFQAALLPGLMAVVLLSIYAFSHQYFFHRDHRKERFGNKISWTRIKTTFRDASWDWPIIVIILLGVFGGYVTIAEVSALVLVYVVVTECFILKEVRFFKRLPAIMIESAMLSGAIIVILGFALGFTGFLVEEQIPARILKFLTDLTQNKFLFLAGLNIFLLAVGCIMDIFSAIIVVVPIMAPIALQYGVDPIHLCILFLVNLEIGYSTPPIGMNLFIAALKFQKPITLLYRATIPYLVLMLLFLVLITYVPVISLYFIQ